MMQEYKEVFELINKGCYSIGDLTDLIKHIPADELEESLDGFVLMKLISKTGKIYHGNSIPPPEKKKRAEPFTGNSLDCTGIDYPNHVKSDLDKVKYLVSEDAPKLQKTMNFFVDDISLQNTGRLLFDSLNSNHIMTSYYISPRINTPGNKMDFSKDVTQARGFSVLVREDRIKINVSLLKPLQRKYANANNEAVADHFEKEFKTYDDFKKWLVENL